MKSALILAAGKGTRMKSALPKVMQPLLGEPLLYYVLAALREAGVNDVMTVVGHGADVVTRWLADNAPGVATVLQAEQKGTGHAVMQAAEWLGSREDVLVINGDMPLVTAKELRPLLDAPLNGGWIFATALLDDPTGYGRVVRDREAVYVVEHKDAKDEQRALHEVNVGLYRTGGTQWVAGLGDLRSDNSQGEYYIVDLLSWASRNGQPVTPVVLPADNLRGVNTPAELAVLNAAMRDRQVSRLMEAGVKFQDPTDVWIGPKVTFAGEAWVAQGVALWGECHFGTDCTISAGCQLTNCSFGDRVDLKPYVVAENSSAESDVVLGPFCFLRDRTFLAQNSRVGKFVELKNSKVGRGSKVPHLSYLGDATLGEKVNIGAATVTCNYDGSKKWPTVVGDRVFVGSDTMLVAPVTLGNDSMTAAGSVVTQDVPSGALAIGRARQVNKEQYRGGMRTEDGECSTPTEKR